MPVAALSSVLNRQFVHLARRSLFQGELATAADLGLTALQRALNAKDKDLSAQSLLLLGRTHIVLSDLQVGYRYSGLAAHLYDVMGHADGRAEALSLVNHAASAMRLPDATVVATDLRQALTAGGLSDRVTGMAHNYLGVSALWDASYKASEDALAQAQDIAASRGRSAADFHPLINQFLLEVFKLVERERIARGPVDYTDLAAMSRRCELAMGRWCSAPIGRDFWDIGMLLLDFANCVTAVRLGDMHKAQVLYQECVLRVIPMPANSWLCSVVWWAKVEVSRGLGDLQAALSALASMELAARSGEHAQMEQLARNLRADIEQA